MGKLPLPDTESSIYSILICLSPEIHFILPFVWTRMILQISLSLRISVTLETIYNHVYSSSFIFKVEFIISFSFVERRHS